MSKNPFDFSDLSDLPEDLQKKLHTEGADHAKEYAEVVRKGIEAGMTELDINQIMAAALRLGMDVPTQQTVRNYLNKAVELNLITKPSRQTYGSSAGKASTKAEDAGLGSDDAVATQDISTPDAGGDYDPLAGI